MLINNLGQRRMPTNQNSWNIKDPPLMAETNWSHPRFHRNWWKHVEPIWDRLRAKQWDNIWTRGKHMWEYLHQGTVMGLQGAYYGLIICILYDKHCKTLPFNKSRVRWTEAIPSQFHGPHPKPRRSRNPGSRHLGPTSPTWAMARHHGPRFLGWLGLWQWKC